jgi:PAS domain S-box-containing protein
MLQVVFAVSGVAVGVGALGWSIATWQLRRSLAGATEPLASRMRELLVRDALVTVVLTLLAVATVSEAFDEDLSGLDLFRAIVLVPVVASLPFVRRYQGRAELAQEVARNRERTRLELLYEVAAAGEDLDMSRAAQRLADALPPTLGDWGLVLLLDAHGEVDALRVSRSGHPADELVEDTLRRYPVELDRDAGLGLAVRSGERVVFEDITEGVLAESAQDEQHLEILRALDLGAAVIEPMTARGRRVGAISILTRRGRPITEGDVELLAEVAQQAAPVLDNSRLHAELVATDRALRFSEAVLRAQGESGVEGVLVVSPDGSILSYNSRFAEMWGFPADLVERGSDEEALAEAMRRVVDPERFIDRVREVYADPTTPARDEVQFTDGRVLDRYGAPLRLDDGTLIGWAWYFRDITDERRAQQSLIESGERFANLARTLQESLLPPDLPHIFGAEIAARYHPAGDGAEIGGDFYDVFQVGESDWCAVMGDVCGKGASAARLTALARYTLRAAAIRSSSIARNLEVLNVALVRQAEIDRPRGENRFATAALVRFHPDRRGLAVRCGSGGHPAGVIVRADGRVDEVLARGPLLGVFEDVRFRPSDERLEDGDVLVLYTDGVTEARRDREEFGEQRLFDLLARCAGMSAADLTAAVESEVLAFQHGVARDDIAVLAIRASGDAMPTPVV